MSAVPFLARLLTWELDTGTAPTEAWVALGGVVDGDHSPSTTKADTSTADTPGRDSHLVASRGDEFTVKCKRKEDEADGSRDAGQEAFEEWGRETGAASIKPFRITTPGGSTITFDASVEVKLFGGGLNDSSDWEAKITVSGDVTHTAP